MSYMHVLQSISIVCMCMLWCVCVYHYICIHIKCLVCCSMSCTVTAYRRPTCIGTHCVQSVNIMTGDIFYTVDTCYIV